MQKKDKVSCTKYTMNLEAANFGECICGAARDLHMESALDTEKAKNARQDSAEVRTYIIAARTRRGVTWLLARRASRCKGPCRGSCPRCTRC